MSSSPTAATVVPHLPTPLTRFVGREAEVAEASTLMAQTRLLTLTGPGGAGKTRLALRLASAVAEDFPDGIWFVDFSPLSGSEFVWDQVAVTLGVREPRGGTLAEAVGRRLSGRQALLVLDNCEHVVDTAAEVTAGLLSAAGALKVVATSREPLGVGGEVTWTVPPLTEDDALELFTDRARLARPRFNLRDEDAAAARSICRRLDGLPLAIELAAARTRALAPARIAAELHDHFRLLPSGPRTAPGRQATLLASFEWSYGLLSEAERALLRQLSVFAGGFDVEAALAVCPVASLDLLSALAERSLIAVEERSEQPEPRYRMLETIREFAVTRLAEAGEVELVHTRHRDHYLELAERAEPWLLTPDDARWQALLTAEQENLRLAMAWSRDHDEPEELARLVAALGWFWGLLNRLTELQRWQEAVGERGGEVSLRLRARLSTWECLIAVFTARRLGEVPALANKALALARAADSKRDEATALVMLGIVAGLVGGAEAMRPYVDEAVPMARSAGFAYGVVMALEFFVVLRLFQSRPEENWRLAEEAIAVAKAGVARHTQLTIRSFSGIIALTQGQLAAAHQILASVVADGREMIDFNYLHSLVDLGLVEMFRGDFAAARSHLDESLAAADRSEAEGRSAAGVGFHSRFVLGWIQLAGGDVDQARDSMAAVVESARSSIIRPIVPLPLVLLAESHLALGELDEAAAALEEATSIADTRKQTWLLGRARMVLAKLRARHGDVQEAESLAHEALKWGREAGDQMGLVDGLELLAGLAAEQESGREAARLWGAAESLRVELGYVRFPVEQRGYEVAVDGAKQSIGLDDFATAWTEGAKLSPEAAIAYAARGRGERRRPTTGWASLTPSELEVVRLVGLHLSNPEIAARLFVSRATVKTHLVHIFSKLGIDSRSELAAEAVRRGVQRSPSLRS